MDTIIALSSGPAPAGVAVVRLSGPQTDSVVKQFVGTLPPPRHAALRTLVDLNGEPIDDGLVLWFPGPQSFTGEDCAELQVHGSRAVIERVLLQATAVSDVRIAEAGEFAQRAFINGKFDLTAAEGLADLIAAETEAQRRFALQQMQGTQQALYHQWRQRMLEGRALAEADIDFTDESDVPGSVADRVWRDMAMLRGEIENHLMNARRGETRRSGFQIVLIGAPNVGKSTLLNALSRSERAIVSDEPGTTRDVIEVRLDLGGYLVLIADTAGLRDAAGPIEAEGMRRARAHAIEADLILHLDDRGCFDGLELPNERPVIWRVLTKKDQDSPEGVTSKAQFSISAITGDGMDELERAMIKEIGRQSGSEQDILPSHVRHIGHLQRAADALVDVDNEVLPIEIRAEKLRIAGHELGRITGAIDVEDVLGAIFSRFCIGK